MSEIDFSKQKIQTNSISKEEFVKKLTDKKVDEEKAKSVFDKLNTNTVGDSAEVLDKNEQVGLMALLKSIAGNDEKITDDEFKAKADLAKTFGFESQELLSNTYEAIKELIAQDTSDDKTVTYNSDGTVKVDDETYSYDNAQFKSKKSKVDGKDITQTMREKYDLVHLNDNWQNSRELANKITSNEDGYKDIKSAKTADQVIDIIIEKQGLTVTDEQKTKLKELLIKFNPSMFNKDTGAVWIDADWSKLDFPTGKDVAKMIGETSASDSSDKVEETEDADAAAEADKSGDAPKTEDPDPDTVESAKMSKDNDGIHFKSEDDTTEYAQIYQSHGAFSWDAHLRITKGKYKGNYKFITSDNDNLNYGKFDLKAVGGGTPFVHVTCNVKAIEGTDENGVKQSFPVTMTSDGGMQVTVNGKIYTLEQFVKLGSEESTSE